MTIAILWFNKTSDMQFPVQEYGITIATLPEEISDLERSVQIERRKFP